jgi:hypothetical protein
VLCSFLTASLRRDVHARILRSDVLLCRMDGSSSSTVDTVRTLLVYHNSTVLKQQVQEMQAMIPPSLDLPGAWQHHTCRFRMPFQLCAPPLALRRDHVPSLRLARILILLGCRRA